MEPQIFAKAIVSIERKYGLRLDARSVWLQLDSTPCGKGWEGTKPGCKRANKSKATNSPAKPDKEMVAKKSSHSEGVPCGVGWEGTKPGCKRIKKNEESQQRKNSKEEPIEVQVSSKNRHPQMFTTSINGKKLEFVAVGNHDPSWSQNNPGVLVTAQKSRSFFSSNDREQLDITEIPPSSFKAFLEAVRENKAYDGVEEFSIAEVYKNKQLNPGREQQRQKTMAQLKVLENAGLVTITAKDVQSEIGTIYERLEVSVHFDKKGRIRKASEKEIASAPKRRKAENIRAKQAEMIEKEHDFPASKDEIADIRRRETELAQEVAKIENDLYDRKPKNTATESEYIKKAKEWAKSQGFVNDGREINGFTAYQAAKHDIAHPATHDLIGMDSKKIHSYFGRLKTSGGKNSLIGEEAIVNVVEHLSRGDSIEASVMSGVRVARMLSRDGTKEEQSYVRTPKFLQDLNALAEKTIRMDDFGSISKVVRESNWESGTITALGNT